MPVRLHINVDHVATVRNARGTRYPDPVLAAQLCEAAGADGITAHLREDRRHITDDDLARLRRSISTVLNLEMAATDEMIAIAERTRPDVITLVPERREERTTEGGLDVRGQRAQIEKCVAMARKAGIKVSLFIAPDVDQVLASRDVGAAQIELHTGEYCHAADGGPGSAASVARELARLVAATRQSEDLGLEVAAGHGLTRHNVGPVIAFADGGGVVEVNIGHSVIADAVLFGLERAVRDLSRAVRRAERSRGAAGGGA
ncbi:MAG TPA: pyridoxine 5'-phosphate synthase [Byssovorax sp.]|jgi:pyridoxine 5-phosphate synthase